MPKQLFITPSTPTPRGLLEPGNLDLLRRPIVRNQDGSTSTVFSMGFDLGDGRQVIVPGVDGKRQLTPDEAWSQYRRTRQHLGIFSGLDEANQYAAQLHQDYETGRVPGYPVSSGATVLRQKAAQAKTRAQTLRERLMGLIQQR